MRKTYEKPVITKLQSSYMNKFGMSTVNTLKVRKDIDGVAIEKLTDQYGSPLFVYSEKTIRRRWKQYYSAFSTRYPDVVFGWSYKTNYLKAICAVMHDEGAWAEVVSKMEYEKARALGIPGQRIIFNGPHKSEEILEQAILDGAMINVDHLDELETLDRIAARLGRPVNVGMRLNLDAGIYPHWSRFGFNLESGDAFNVVRHLSQEGRIRIVGLHCHIGTYILDPTAYGRQIKKMLQFAYEIEDRFGFQMEYIDIGGGFPSLNKLKGTYLPPDIAVPSIDEYAIQICDAMHESLRPGHQPKLILESGRALIDETGFLVTSVLASKRLVDGTRAYVVDAGINLLYTAFWYQYKIEMDTENTGLSETSVVYGPMCMNIDAIDEGVQLPPLERGNRLIVSPVGAYNNTQWLQFIEYRPNVVMISPDGQVNLIREAEDLSDIERREKMPAHLERA